MSEQNEETDPLGIDVLAGDSEPVVDEQIAKLKDEGLTWEFEGKDFPLFLVNRTGNVGTTILHPTTHKPMAFIEAEFAWDNGQPFLDHLDMKIRDEKSTREDESIRKRANATAQHCKLFKATVQRGSVTKIDEFGERGEAVAKTHDQLCDFAPELQSQLIDDWLGNFHVERHFPEGTDDVDAMLNGVEKVFFKVTIGSYKNPAHVLILEYLAPTPDARRSYEDGSMQAASKQEGDVIVQNYNVNFKTKLNWARKYFVSAQGVVLSKSNELDVDSSKLIPFVTNRECQAMFRADFNAHWFILLADHLANAFNFQGK